MKGSADNDLTMNEKFKKPIKIGVSGKRFIDPGEKTFVYGEIKRIIDRILRNSGTTGFIGYTALAAGADTIFANVVKNEFHQPLRIVFPFPVEEYKKDFEGDDLAAFENLLNDSVDHEIVETKPLANSESRNIAYFNVGKKIVDETDEMIFVWDELKPGGTGGTAEIIGYLAETQPAKRINYIPVKPKAVDHFNELIVGKYTEADNIAVKRRDSYRRVWKSAIVLGWFAVLIFAVNTAFHPAKYELLLLSLEFGLVSTVLILVLIAHKKEYHRQYLDYRMKAEKFRLLRSFYHAGVAVKVSEHTEQADKELADLVRKSNEEAMSPEKTSKWYSQYVIKTLIDDQCNYHKNKIKSIGNKHHRFEPILFIIAMAFFLNLLLYFISVIFEHTNREVPFVYPHDINIFLSIVLTATYAALEGFIHFNEWTLLKKYAEFAQNGLTASKDLLPAALALQGFEDFHKQQSEVLNSVSAIMLTDNRNWSLLLENKGNYNMIV